MKRKNKKLLTLILAGTLCAATVGAVSVMNPLSTSADTTERTASLTQIFEAKDGAEISAKKINEADAAETATFTLENEESVIFKRDLAFKWFTAKDKAEYLNMDFIFADVNFDSLEFRFESSPASATVSGKAVNVVKFAKNKEGKITACVLNGDEKTADETALDIVANTPVKISLSENSEYGKFTVNVNGVAVGAFENVGANYSDYNSGTSDSLCIKATTSDSKSTTLYLNEINAQKFNNIKTEESQKVVTDTASPVLVLKEDINGLLLGAKVSLSYEKIDVLDQSGITETKMYYQYNPLELDKAPDEKNNSKYKVLTTTTYFMDTVYEKDGETTSVYREEGQEYVAIKISLGDGSNDKVAYQLAWYAAPEFTKSIEYGTETKTTTDFIIADRNEEGAQYRHITAVQDPVTKKWSNEVSAQLAADVEKYNEELEKKINDEKNPVKAGSNSYMLFPSLDWLISDNNGYSALSFTICYKSPSSTSSKTSSNLSSTNLKLAASEEGLYEFKVFATDKAGNTMKYADKNGKLVSVSTSNIWDIEEIPTFSYTLKNQGVSVEETNIKNTDRVSTQLLSETYTFSDVTIVGATTQKSDYALYKVDVARYNNSLKAEQKPITQAILSSIKYETIRANAAAKIPTVEDGNYFKLYIEEYAKEIAKALGASQEDVKKIKECFVEIEAYDDRISEEENPEEWEKNNKYNWQPTSKSFTAAEEGTYLIMADYWDEDMSRIDRVPAYRLIVVDAEADVIKGETQWLQNNLVSVILFSVAALMLIAIIVLLLVKPSDETLADVDAKAAAKKMNKKNK